ncbi:hypothetical protein N7492_001358 [Penicillium capsulatum]|uniref:Uncharacterized protein n=1 Tax=Penicillium capsulatum TaxID=69766 RepID=A0A9W9M127_9EURO|nr:hypothetical protein N7492_001358 [Penicillium capsulatum]KAJ6129583.1 hypothetical protein N7512_002363 [Penicillium capsulatum]
MKFAATLSLLATLAAQAYCQEVVTFQAKGQDLALTAPQQPGEAVSFSKRDGQHAQLWQEIYHGSQLFAYQSVANGDFINCGDRDGICRTLEEPQIFEKFHEGPDVYFSYNGFSGLLQRTNSSQLKLARPTSDFIEDNQLFTLQPASQCK